MLKEIIKWGCLLSALCLLTACGPMYRTSYTYVPPASASGKICVMQCQRQKDLCQQLCQSRSNNCRQKAQNNARIEYDQYAADRRASGKPVKKTVEDFYNSFACADQPKCSCEPDFRACFQLCGGQVTQHRECVAFCDQKGAAQSYQNSQ
jgi:hypothetical protein